MCDLRQWQSTSTILILDKKKKKRGENSYSCGLYLYGLYVLNSKLNEEFGYYSTSTSMSKTHYDTQNKKKIFTIPVHYAFRLRLIYTAR